MFFPTNNVITCGHQPIFRHTSFYVPKFPSGQPIKMSKAPSKEKQNGLSSLIELKRGLKTYSL